VTTASPLSYTTTRDTTAAHHQHAAIAILDVGGMHEGVHQQALRVDENVPLLAFDLLARVVAMRIVDPPLFQRFSRSGCR
jgi:hypothetical protein